MAAKDQLKDLEKRIIIGPVAGEWFHLLEADTKFNAMGDYKVTVYPEPGEIREHFEAMKAIAEAALPIYQEEENAEAAKKKRKPKELKLSDTQPWLAPEMENGTLQLKLKRPARFTEADGGIKDINLPVVDSKGAYLSKEQLAAAKVGNGSIVRVVCTMRPYNMATQGVGISLRLEKVQLIKVVPYGGSGVDNEFGEFEGGEFAAPEVQTASTDGELGQKDETNYTV